MQDVLAVKSVPHAPGFEDFAGLQVERSAQVVPEETYETPGTRIFTVPMRPACDVLIQTQLRDLWT